MAKKSRKFILFGVDGAMRYLAEKFMAEGALPNLAALAKRGVMATGLPCYPTDTPTNWTTLATGARTGTHGVTSFAMHLGGEDLAAGEADRERTMLAETCQAEYLWQSAARQGLRSLVVHYPSGWGLEQEGIMMVGGWGLPSAAPYLQAAEPSTHPLAGKSGQVQAGREEQPTLITLQWEQSGPRVQIWVAGAPAQKIELTSGGPGQWLQVPAPLIPGEEYDLLAFAELPSPDTLQLSALFRAGGWTRPHNLAADLVRRVSSFCDTTLIDREARLGYELAETEQQRLGDSQLRWRAFADTFKVLQNDPGWDILYFHIHLLDNLNHHYLGDMYPKHPRYTPERAKYCLEVYRQGYRAVDEMLGQVMEECVDEETVVCLTADHAALPAWRLMQIVKIMIAAGLTRVGFNEAAGHYEVDWKQTRALAWNEPPYVWVNLKGREPHGIVEPGEEYEQVRDEIIEALSSARDPETGLRPVKLALRKEDLWHLHGQGERLGDVVYFQRPPYMYFDWGFPLTQFPMDPDFLAMPTYFTAGEGKTEGEVSGYHCTYLPTETMGSYQVAPLTMFAGHGIKQGVRLEQPVELLNVCATACHLLDIPTPAQNEGRPLWEVLED